VIRSIRFADEPDPAESVREEIFLEKELARRAEQTDLVNDQALLADIDFYQGQEILNMWLRNQVAADAVTSESIAGYYETHKAGFSEPERMKFRHLFLLVPPDDEKAGKAKKEQADKLHQQLRRGAEFERLVGEYSEIKGARENKGVVGPVDSSRLNPAIRQGLSGLKPGEVSGPVRTPYGWELLELMERTPSAVKPLSEVSDSIRTSIISAKAREIQGKAAEYLNGRFTPEVNDALLSGTGVLSTDSVVLTVGSRRFTVEAMLRAIHATYAFDDVKDERERIRAALPRMILTEQVKQAAEADGFLESAESKAKLTFIRNRLLGEQHYNRLKPRREPSELDLKAAYAKERDVFTSPPMAKGVLYRWSLPEEAQTTSGAMLTFHREALLGKVEKITGDARAGRISREDLAKKADEVVPLDWFREGPMGYSHDKAFFGAEAGNFTEIYPTRTGYALGWVEAKKPREPIPFEECRELVRKRVINMSAVEERKALLEEILREYALLP
jgi:hypothetical protein